MWDTVRSFILELRYQRLISHFRMFRFYWLNFMCCQGNYFLPSILFKSSLSFTRGHNQCYSICFIKRHFFIKFHYCDSDASYIHFIMLPNYLMVILLKISLSQIIRVISPGSKACLLSHHVSWRSRSIVNISRRSGLFWYLPKVRYFLSMDMWSQEVASVSMKTSF